jgi:hypothetical protein
MEYEKIYQNAIKKPALIGRFRDELPYTDLQNKEAG